MADVDEFVLEHNERHVFGCSTGASWALRCWVEHCPAAHIVGYENAAQAVTGALGHLRWHADGMRMCRDCDSTLGPEDQVDRCAAGTCPADEEVIAPT